MLLDLCINIKIYGGTARVAEIRLAGMKVGRLAEIAFEQNPTCQFFLKR